MAITLKAFANCDDVFLAWSPGEAIPDCLGFAIQCRRGKNGVLGKATAISNRVGFKADNPKAGDRKPSTVWPFQRYDWTDHAADLGDEIEYRVVARIGTPGALRDGPVSDWTGLIKLDAECDGARALFNRGFVISQFVARLLKDRHLTLAQLKEQAGEVENDIRNFLSGVLRKELLALLAEVKRTAGVKAYAALYELGDDELEAALIACGDKIEIVLANGSVKVRGDDQNEDARTRLKQAGLVVHDRMVSPGALGHNKFIVLSRRKGQAEQPFKLLTGSTNWTTTGLCTQVNNAVVLPDAELAAAYFEHWKRLRDAGSDKPSTLAAANPSPVGPFDLTGRGRATGWLTPVKQGHDVERLIDLVNDAREGVLFVMFNPGGEPLHTLLKRQREGFYVRGVVNQIGAAQRAEIQLVKNGAGEPFFLDVIEPSGATVKLAEWAAEVTRQQFMSEVGFAITHSKVLVIDPFGEKPVVVTGSHNFSNAASKTNDDNFVIVEGNSRLAEAYAVNCMMTYQHYRWRQYLQESARKHLSAFEFLNADPAWQARLTSANTKADQAFWL